MALHAFRPRLLECLKGYDRTTLAADVSAVVTVGVIALPLAAMAATFLLTVMVDLTVAVQIGLVLAALFFIHRISSLTTIEPVGAEVALPQGAAASPCH